jgi:hypothetical protein
MRAPTAAATLLGRCVPGQVHKHFRVLGLPHPENWSDGCRNLEHLPPPTAFVAILQLPVAGLQLLGACLPPVRARK